MRSFICQKESYLCEKKLNHIILGQGKEAFQNFECNFKELQAEIKKRVAYKNVYAT